MDLHDFDSVPAGFLAGSAVTVGNFDGVHLGHREIIRRTVAHARTLAVPAALLTFDPHPREVVSRGQIVPAILPFNERARIISSLGIDHLFKVCFTPDFACRPAEQFVEDLVARLAPKVVVIGHDFRFGKDRLGGAELLRGMGARLGFMVEGVPVVEAGGKPVSSTRIRGLIQAGELLRARALLGAPFTVCGVVVRGHGRGAGLGFATANLRAGARLLPPDGVYVALACFDGREQPAVVNIGHNPTFGDMEKSIEAHLLDFRGDLYDRELRLCFLARLRGEVKFGGVEELKAQVARDIAEARRVLAGEAAR